MEALIKLLPGVEVAMQMQTAAEERRGLFSPLSIHEFRTGLRFGACVLHTLSV